MEAGFTHGTCGRCEVRGGRQQRRTARERVEGDASELLSLVPDLAIRRLGSQRVSARPMVIVPVPGTEEASLDAAKSALESEFTVERANIHRRENAARDAADRAGP